MQGSAPGDVMDLATFFDLVLPGRGYIIIGEPLDIPGQKTSPYRHHVFASMDDAIAKAVDLNFQQKNVFFALAGFREAKVWNPTAKKHDGSLGKWQTRTQSNAGWMRSFFLDLDVDTNPTPEKSARTFLSKEAAVAELRDFCREVGLPRPMLVDSGGGIHAYWPLEDDVPVGEWQPVADKFKSVCLHRRLRIDPAVPSDAARVLRVPGCHNLKRNPAREVRVVAEPRGVVPLSVFSALLSSYEESKAAGELPAAPRRAPSAAYASGFGASNLGQTGTPSAFGHIMFRCRVIGQQVATGGRGTSEPLWWASIGLAKHTVEGEQAMLALSDQYEGFDIGTMRAYAAKWSAGPTTCNYFETRLGCSECASCPARGTITSPIQLGHMVEAPPPAPVEVVNLVTGVSETLEVVEPPFPYTFTPTAGGGRQVSIRVSKDGEDEMELVSPYEMYPIRIMREVDGDLIRERTMWRFHLPRMQPVDMPVPQGIIGDRAGLHKLLLNAGVYVNEQESKKVQSFMSAYLKKLAAEMDRERLFPRLGWHSDYTEFVLGHSTIKQDGSVVPCNVSPNVRNTLKGSMAVSGTLADWCAAVNTHYAADIYASHRFFLYCAFAAPLLHMTGHKGVLVTAAGRSGRGKTTVLRAGSSIWGAPDALVLNGNPDGSTNNAMFNFLGTAHSVPMMWDDVTERDMDEVLRLTLNISQGKGKERMKGSEHDGRAQGWETIILSSANYDNVAKALAARKDAEPHLMRTIGVSFDDFVDTTEGKLEADKFIRTIGANYGHAGAVFMRHVVMNYASVKQAIEQTQVNVDSALKAKGHERYWSAVITCAVVAGTICKQLGLLHFDMKKDFEWMKNHINSVRAAHSESQVDAVEQLSMFLESRISNTLVLAAKQASNLDNVARYPVGQLTIRHEVDRGLLFIARSEIAAHCVKFNLAMKDWEDELVAREVVTKRAGYKTLGADTTLAKGQVRCWTVDASKLGAAFTGAAGAAAVVPQNVIPMPNAAIAGTS